MDRSLVNRSNGFSVKSRPVVFYGTSITQGASAMRPGMGYPAIISRHLNIETINLGFSGNGKMEKELAEALSEIDASCYVIDCGGKSYSAACQEKGHCLLFGCFEKPVQEFRYYLLNTSYFPLRDLLKAQAKNRRNK